mmetsp:Transcript_37217/g.114949  ORF Transcript_37217/g.114949 Transcript_37217/m.114949 type:complete len:240 (+) Transcript_37217:106-825(+)
MRCSPCPNVGRCRACLRNACGQNRTGQRRTSGPSESRCCMQPAAVSTHFWRRREHSSRSSQPVPTPAPRSSGGCVLRPAVPVTWRPASACLEALLPQPSTTVHWGEKTTGSAPSFATRYKRTRASARPSTTFSPATGFAAHDLFAGHRCLGVSCPITLHCAIRQDRCYTQDNPHFDPQLAFLLTSRIASSLPHLPTATPIPGSRRCVPPSDGKFPPYQRATPRGLERRSHAAGAGWLDF